MSQQVLRPWLVGAGDPSRSVGVSNALVVDVVYVVVRVSLLGVPEGLALYPSFRLGFSESMAKS